MSARPWTALQSSIVSSEKLYQVSNSAALFYVLLLTQVDSFGRIEAGPVLLFTRVFPGRPRETPDTVQQYVEELAASGLVELYQVSGRAFLRVPDWEAKAGATMRAKDRRKADCPPPGGEQWDASAELVAWKAAQGLAGADSGRPGTAPGAPGESPGSPREVPGNSVARTVTETGTYTEIPREGGFAPAPAEPATAARAPRRRRRPWSERAEEHLAAAPSELLGLWRRWLDHLGELQRIPTDSAVRSHLAKLVEVHTGHGLDAATRLVDDGIQASASGFPTWAVERAQEPRPRPLRRTGTDGDSIFDMVQDGRVTVSPGGGS